MASVERDKRGRFFSEKKKRSYTKTNVLIDHNFGLGHTCDVPKCLSNECPLSNNYNFGKNVSRDGWKTGAGLYVPLPLCTGTLCTIFGSYVPYIGYIRIMVGLLLSVEGPVEG